MEIFIKNRWHITYSTATQAIKTLNSQLLFNVAMLLFYQCYHIMMNSLKLSARHLKTFFPPFFQIPFSLNKTDNISEVLRSGRPYGCARDARVLSARINSHLSNKATSIFIHRCVSGPLSRIFFFLRCSSIRQRNFPEEAASVEIRRGPPLCAFLGEAEAVPFIQRSCPWLPLIH